MVQNVAEFSKRSTSNNISQQQKPSLVHRDSDSDIETIEDSNNTKAVEEGGESNLDSLNSDGIPVGEELNESGEAQYLWSSECSGISQISSPEEDDHDDDMEIVDKSETKLETSSGINSCKNLFTYFVFYYETFQTHFKQSLKSNPKHLFFFNAEYIYFFVSPISDPICSSGYPPAELMDRFSEIIKGRTYLHQPNQALNLYLTATLVIVVAMVLGLGVGHFKG